MPTASRIQVSIHRTDLKLDEEEQGETTVMTEAGVSRTNHQDATTLSVEIVPEATSVRRLLDRVRAKLCHSTVAGHGTAANKRSLKNLVVCLAQPNKVQVELKSILLPGKKEEDDDDSNSSSSESAPSSESKTIGDVLQNGDAIIIQLDRSNEDCSQYSATTTTTEPRLHKVSHKPTTQQEDKGDITIPLKELLTYKLTAYHICTGMQLVAKPAVEHVDVVVDQRRIRFVLPSKDYRNTRDDVTLASTTSTIKFVSAGVERTMETFELFSDTLQDLHDGILQAFGIFAFMASKHRLSLWSPDDGKHWHEDAQEWERTNHVRIPELGLSGPVLEGRFEVLSLVMVKTTIAGKTIALRVRLSDTANMVKKKLEDIIGIKPVQQRLLYRDSPLEDNLSLLQHGVVPRSTLKLFLCLPESLNKNGAVRDAGPENDSEACVSIRLVLPSGREETIEVDPSSSLSRLQALVLAIHRSNLKDDHAVRAGSSFKASQSCCNEDVNIRPSAVAATVAQMKLELSDRALRNHLQRAVGNAGGLAPLNHRKVQVVDRRTHVQRNNENEPNKRGIALNTTLIHAQVKHLTTAKRGETL